MSGGFIINGNSKHFIGAPSLPPPPQPQPTPAAWLPRIARGDMLYAAEDVSVPADLHPMIGNGFVSTQVMSQAIYCAGIFSGDQGARGVSHRARIPAVHAVPAPGTSGPAALDLRA